MTDWTTLEKLAAVIDARRGADPAASYVAKLFKTGKAKQKVGEEALELALAAATADRAGMVSESADLLFHLLVLWQEQGIAPAEVLAELARREGISGIDEKQNRRD